MPKLNIVISDELLAKLEKAKEDYGISIASIARMGVEAQVDKLLTEGYHVPPKGPVESAKPQEDPPGPPITPFLRDGTMYIPVAQIEACLGFKPDALVPYLDDEDIKTIGGETCIASMGISTALALAKRRGQITVAFERRLRRFEQDLLTKPGTKP